MYICETCREEVEPADSGIVYAVEMVDATTMTGPGAIEGLGVFFHEGCYPHSSSDYRRKPMPESLLHGVEE